MSNKILDLLKTKAQLEAEIKAEEDARRDEAIRAEREKARIENEKREAEYDRQFVATIMPFVERIRNMAGDKINDQEFMFALMVLVATTWNNKEFGTLWPAQNVNTFYSNIERFARTYGK